MGRLAPLDVTPALQIPPAELRYRASRAGGPGGQHVNTSATRVEVVWDIAASASLTEEQRLRLLANLAPRLDGRGRLRIVAAASRSQQQNLDAATDRLRGLVADALRVPKQRRPTKPTLAARAARIDAKRRRSARKRERRRIDEDA